MNLKKVGDSKLHKIYRAKDLGEVEERYNQWADTYERDINNEYGWPSPSLMAKICLRYIPLHGTILDAGAGTGLLGQALSRVGFDDIVGIDLSSQMLAQARQKRVYKSLRKMNMGTTLDFSDAIFDAVTSVGALTISHAPASALDELTRVTKPNGYMMFTIRPDFYVYGGFEKKLGELEKMGHIRFIMVTDPFQAIPLSEPEVDFQIWVYQKPHPRA